jgi:oxygen-dependent protoporphyrinogen oxidase
LTRVARFTESMPQYLVGHAKRIALITDRLAAFPSLALAGNAYRGVGLADCVHSGEDAADAVLQSFERRTERMASA